MNLKSIIYTLIVVFSIQLGYSQTNDDRIQKIRNQLEIISSNSLGLTEELNADVALNDITLSNFILAISNVHKVNINVDPSLSQTVVTTNFSEVTVATTLLFLCKEYNLTIEFTDNIMSIKPYVASIKMPEVFPIAVDYDPESNEISIDVKDNTIYDVFRTIMDASAKNLVFAPGMENINISTYIKPTDFNIAMDKLALANNLILTRTKDDFYVFDKVSKEANSSFSNRLSPGLNFEIINKKQQLINVDFIQAPIVDIINAIGDSLAIDRFTATPLEETGFVDFRAKAITFDDMLIKIFEQQTEVETPTKDENPNTSTSNRGSTATVQEASNQNKRFTFKKDNGIYFFGTEKQLSVRKVEIIKLRNRSVNMMPDPKSDINSSVVQDNFNRGERNFQTQNTGGLNNVRPQNRNFQAENNQEFNDGEVKSILDLIPDEVKGSLDCKIDVELNSIYVTGTSAEIEFFKNFIKNLDKTIPLIMIEVMIIEANTSNAIEAGVEWGIGDNPETTRGAIFPTTDLTLGAKTINKVINGFNSASAFNFGQVVPNFFATVKAMETNGNLKIKSTPKLAILNGHRASFSNGQTSYYAVTNRNTQGTDNPIVNEIRNFFPIDAKLGLDIKPFVTGSGEVLLEIQVVQSSFGQRIDEDAPPDINSRNFSSIVRMKDQDIAVLGGLEENFKNNSGSGVPFLARIPIIKWLFSKRVREARKSKLTVFIKPTVIY